MSPYEYYKSHDRAVIQAVAKRAGTNLAYFEQLARGYRSPSIKLAKRLVLATDHQVPLIEWLPDLKDSAA